MRRALCRTSTLLTATATALASAVALSAPSAAAGLITGADPDQVREVASGFGSATLKTDSENDPLIEGRIDGIRYNIYFYGCDSGKNCTSIQFWTYLDANSEVTSDHVNAWNRDMRFGNAYIDGDGALNLSFDVNLYGGVSPENLDDTFDWWRAALRKLTGDFDGAIQPDATETPGLQRL